MRLGICGSDFVRGCNSGATVRQDAPEGADLSLLFSGANARDRTADLLITNQLLYRLSYVGSRPAKGITRACARQVIAVVRPGRARRRARAAPMMGKQRQPDKT